MPVHTSLTIYALRAMAASCWIFPLRKLLFFDLTCYLFEIAYFCSPNRELSNGARLEQLCWEKNIDPSGNPYYSDHVRSSHNVFFALSNALILQFTSYPAEIAHFNSPNRELSNFVRLMELYWSKIVDPSCSPCLKIVNWKRFERPNSLLLRPVLLKNAYFNSANPELSKGVRLVELR